MGDAQARLEELAQRGRAQREAQARAREAEQQFESRRGLRKARLATTPLGAATGVTAGLALGLGSAMLGTVALFKFDLWDLLKPSLGDRPAEAVAIVCAVLVIPAIFVVTPHLLAAIHSRFTFGPALAWALGLPYALDGFKEMLAHDGCRVARVRVKLKDASEEAGRFVLDVALGCGYEASFAGELQIIAPLISTGFMTLSGGSEMDPPTNYRYYVFLRRLDASFLSAIHQQHPVERVRVEAR